MILYLVRWYRVIDPSAANWKMLSVSWVTLYPFASYAFILIAAALSPYGWKYTKPREYLPLSMIVLAFLN